jgi:hypothetical protein
MPVTLRICYDLFLIETFFERKCGSKNTKDTPKAKTSGTAVVKAIVHKWLSNFHTPILDIGKRLSLLPNQLYQCVLSSLLQLCLKTCNK